MLCVSVECVCVSRKYLIGIYKCFDNIFGVLVKGNVLCVESRGCRLCKCVCVSVSKEYVSVLLIKFRCFSKVEPPYSGVTLPCVRDLFYKSCRQSVSRIHKFPLMFAVSCRPHPSRAPPHDLWRQRFIFPSRYSFLFCVRQFSVTWQIIP